MQRVGQHAAVGRRAFALLRLEHDGAGAVAKQHASAAVVPVEDAREGLGTDHQGGRSEATLDHAVGHRQAIDEAGTHRLDVERRTAGHAQALLHPGSGRRKGFVGGRRCEHDQIEVRRLQAATGQRFLGCFERKVRGELAVGRDVALANAGALPDPLVRGIHLRSQFVVGDDTLGKVGTAALDDRPNH